MRDPRTARQKWLAGHLPAWMLAVYRPTPPPRLAGPALSVIVGGVAIARGLDFLSIPPSTPPTEVLAYLDFIGLQTWGLMFLMVGFGLWTSLISRGLFPLVAAHLFGAAVWAGYLVAIVQGTIATGEQTFVLGLTALLSVAAGWGIQMGRLPKVRTQLGMLAIWEVLMILVAAHVLDVGTGIRFVAQALGGVALNVIRLSTLRGDIAAASRRAATRQLNDRLGE